MIPSVGRGLIRKDGRDKVTGRACYSDDWPEKNVVYGIIIQSTIPSGKIDSFNLSQSKKVPGVIDIITHENTETIHAISAKSKPGTGDPKLPLQDDNVYYNGQPIGIVIADTLEAAEQAANLIKIEYREKDGKLNFEKERKSSAKTVKIDSNGRKATENKGNIAKQIKNSPVIHQATYTLPIENHHPMEPSATFAIWEGKQLRVYESTQGVSNAHDVFGDAFKVKKDDVRVITKFVGGGFGCKGSVWSHALLAVMAAQKTKRSVKVANSRIQMATNVGYRAHTVQDVTLACDTKGKLNGIKHETVNPTAIHKNYPETTGALFKLLYEAPAISSTQKLVTLNVPPPTFMRAPGECSGSFALESAMDELAHKLQIDPVELRLINYAEKDPMKNVPFSSKSLKQCYEQAAAKFDWGRRKSTPRTNRQGDYYFGYGMATASYPVHFFPAKAQVRLFADGTAEVRSATQDIGTGTYTVMGQLAADFLGLDYKNIKFDLGDSDYPSAGVSGGSSTVSSVGWAIAEASKDAIEKLKRIAVKDPDSPLYELKLAQLTAKEGRLISAQNSNVGESYGTLLTRNKLEFALGEGKMDEKIQKANEKKYSQHSYGAQFVEVKVNAFTGEVTLVKLVSAFAAGKIVNPKTARNQFMGGIIFGIGMGLTEHNIIDERYGKFMARDLADYHVPVNKDVPSLEIIMVNEVDNIVNPAGTKGIGEIGVVGVAAAIANAVFNATGIRVRDMPITPDKLVVDLQKG